MQKIVSVIGARPQFVKAAALSRKLRSVFNEVMVHTGQHYNDSMSKIFFDQLDLPHPEYNLGVREHNHGEQTGKMLIALERVLLKEKPSLVLVYGDTNSTLAGALAAAKLHIPIAHVEAGMRSYNRGMPEEVNRVLTDHLSDLLFCPTKSSIQNLRKEGITKGVHFTGDVMLEIFTEQRKKAKGSLRQLAGLMSASKVYFLLTFHRAENTDNRKNLESIINTLTRIKDKIIFPIHPRTKKALIKYKLWNHLKNSENFSVIEPVGYADMIRLEREAKIILTDSGGVQKEAYFLKVPCITLRNETEWIETLENGWNLLAGTNRNEILLSLKQAERKKRAYNPHFGAGDTSERIITALKNYLLKHG